MPATIIPACCKPRERPPVPQNKSIASNVRHGVPPLLVTSNTTTALSYRDTPLAERSRQGLKCLETYHHQLPGSAQRISVSDSRQPWRNAGHWPQTVRARQAATSRAAPPTDSSSADNQGNACGEPICKASPLHLCKGSSQGLVTDEGHPGCPWWGAHPGGQPGRSPPRQRRARTRGETAWRLPVRRPPFARLSRLSVLHWTIARCGGSTG